MIFLSEIIEEVLKSRYYLPGETCWEDICMRVSDFVGNNEEERKEFYELIAKREFIPNSPCLFNAGTPNPMMSACFAIGIDDSMDSIYSALYKSAILFKLGAGVGFNFSRIRPNGAPVGSTNGVASGVLSFMRVFNESIDVIKAAGKRRGASIAILNCDHPEIEDFIKAKTVDGKLTNFNISVMLTDSFLHAVEQDKDWDLKFNDEIYKTVKAKELFKLMYESTWKYGDPGYLFYNTINKNNPNWHLGNIDACNPCGEVCILTDYKTGGGESCNLLSIDVSKFLTEKNELNKTKLERAIRSAIRFENNVIEKNIYPFPEIEKMTKATAKVGLGIMGFVDLLVMQKTPYDSPEATKLAEDLMKYINDIAISESVEIAKENGCYPAWEGSEWYNKGIKIANSTLTCQAPCGTISILADCSSGIEPILGLVHKRKNCVDKEFFIVHKLFEKELKKECEKNNENYDKVIQHCYETGTIQDIPWLSKEFKEIFKASSDIHWKDHINIQAAFQKNCGNSISKTINASNDTKKEEIRDAILYSWKSGCKGMTLYRQGSKENEVITLAKKPIVIPKIDRPEVLFGTTYQEQSGCSKLYATINYKDNNPYEMFVFTGGSGGCQAQNEAIGRLTSLLLRNGTDYRKVVRQLKKVKCPVAIKNPKSAGKSCSAIIGDLLSKSMGDDDAIKDKQVELPEEPVKWDKPKCPDCGEPLEFGEGCNKGSCPNCAWSGCTG